MIKSWNFTSIVLLMQEEGSGTRPIPSSSKMINFELSNGHLNGPHVPMSVDDDEYVEYSFDDMPDFPSNVEEEERVKYIILCLVRLIY